MIYEGQRVQVTDKKTVTVVFNERHDVIPTVSTCFELSSGTPVNVYVKSINQLNTIIEFSDTATGYLHLHAISRIP